ncbi:MFS transporter, partial [Modestobacter versicolor]
MTAPPAPTATRRWWVLLVLCLSVLLVSVDNTIVNVALPTIGRELSASTSDLQWVVDGYTLAFAALLLLGGALGDRFGRRRVLELGLVAFAATSLLAALADTTGELVAGRAAMGVSAAAIYPATLALLVTTFTDRRERATAIGIWSAVTGLSVAIGPVTGGLLLEHFSWGSVFLVNLPLAAVAVVAGRLLLTESADPRRRRFDLVGAAASIAGIGLLVWTTIEAPGRGWGSTATVGGYLAAAVALAFFVVWELRRADPMLDVRLFGDRRVSVGSGAIALAFFSLFGFIFLITQYFQTVRGYDTLTAGLATLPFALVIGAVSPLAILAMRAVGTKLVVAAGLLTMAAGFALAAGTSLESAYWGRIVLAMVLMAAGLGLVTGPATEAVMGALRSEEAGAGSAVNDTVREVGGTLGVAVVGSVMSTVYGPAVVDALT